MSRRMRPVVAWLALILLFCLALPVGAQTDPLPTLTIGQPLIGQITPGAAPPRYAYALSEPGTLSLQAVSETLPPTITIFRGDQVVAVAPNAIGGLVIVLDAFLLPGDYVIEVGTTGDAAGVVVLLPASQSTLPVTDLALGAEATGEVSNQTPRALFRFTAIAEPSFVSLESGLLTGGVTARLLNQTSGREIGVLDGELLGGRFRVPAGTATYLLQVEPGGSGGVEPFTLCWVAVSVGACGLAPQPPAATEEPTAAVIACTVTPVSSAVNIRFSASTSSAIIGSLVAGQSANVLGIAPDRSFYNIQFGGVNGWVAASVVTASGECASIPTVNPPPFVAPPTQPPAPTQAPPAPTQPPPPPPPSEPTQPPPTPVPSGPCLLTINSPVFVYTQPTAQVDYLYDQVQGGELIPNGRLADNSWWRTNYAGAWVQTGLIGGALTMSGNCGNLPVVSP